MTYAKQLPRIREILELSKLAKPFPMTRWEIELIAKRHGMSRALIDFLKLFPENEAFDSRADFMTRCEELEMLIMQERELPHEQLRSPQD